MTMKTRDYLAILVTSILLSFFEMLNRKTLRLYRLSHNDTESCNHGGGFSITFGSHRLERDCIPSPNSRCGFVTGDVS